MPLCSYRVSNGQAGSRQEGTSWLSSALLLWGSQRVDYGLCAHQGMSSLTCISECITKRQKGIFTQKTEEKPVNFMLTFDIWMVSFRALCRTALSRQMAATALPCCIHARSECYLSLSFVLHLGEDRTLPSCLLCVKTPKVARPFTSSCILTCLNSRNTFPRFLSKLQTSSVHTMGLIFF